MNRSINKVLKYLSILALCNMSVPKCFSQKTDPAEKYTNLKKELATGWNTWNTRSVLSHVLLPEGFSINLELKDKASGKFLREALIGRRGEGVETISAGLHSYDGAYTELIIEWQSIKVKIESSASGNDLVILITPLSKSNGDQLLIRPEILWDRKGTITKNQNGFIAHLSSGNLNVDVTNSIKDIQYNDSSVLVAPLQKTIAINTGEKKSLQDIENIIGGARKKLLTSYNKYPRLVELDKAMQNVLSWDVIYEPTHDRVIAPVSRIWSVDAKG
ncbi:MAG: hypothetical protein M3R50_06875, partial [Bacteroidota bacterium]|nr:hypothetical protein [Bacteroidota bacterium]